MNRTRRLLPIACLLGLAMAALLWLSRPSGPTYQGRDVEGWLRLREMESGGYNFEGHAGYYATPEVVAALEAMGDKAVPELVRLALAEPKGKWRRQFRNWLVDNFPGIEIHLPGWMPDWFNQGLVVPNIAVSAVLELRPIAEVLFPLVTNQLALPEVDPKAMELLTAVRDRRKEAAQLLTPAVRSGNPFAVRFLGTFGIDGVVAIPALIECLKTGEASEDDVLCLGRFGAASSNAIPLLKGIHEHENNHVSRMQIAVSAANIAPQDWALLEIRNALTGADAEAQDWTLEMLGRAPNAAALLDSELTDLAYSQTVDLRLRRLALEAFANGAVDPKRAVQTLEQCLGSTDAGIRAVAAGNLIDRQPQHTIALRCLTNAVTDPSLWNRDGYYPATPKSVIARLVRPGIVTPPIMTLVRQQAAEHERERIVDDALKELRRNR